MRLHVCFLNMAQFIIMKTHSRLSIHLLKGTIKILLQGFSNAKNFFITLMCSSSIIDKYYRQEKYILKVDNAYRQLQISSYKKYILNSKKMIQI